MTGVARSLAGLSAYVALAVVMTWPLAPGLARDVPGDLGDPLLNMWILGWGAEQVPGLLAGTTTLREYWNANIFHPEPLALGFSEHLFGEVLQILPVYWLTGNLILCYNLLFLSSFALSGWAMYLLAFDLLEEYGIEGRRRALAAFIAGLVFAFVPYRIAQIAHIQSLQAQWMPLALFGFRRFIVGGRLRALALGTIALLMQNWSNGYYLVFFTPLVPLFVLHQMWTHNRLAHVRTWAAFAIAGLVVALGTVPFLLLYLETQRVHAFERPLAEVLRYSADVYSYLTAPQALRIWGDVMQALPRPEGELFFGFVPWLLALIALWPGGKSRRQAAAGDRVASGGTWPHRIAARVLIACLLAGLVAFAVILFTGGVVTSLAGLPVRLTDATRVLAIIAIIASVLLAISPPARARALGWARSPVSICTVCTIVALWLSLGPVARSDGRLLDGLGLYGVLYEHVPGFDGLRVPARYAMVAAVFLAILGGMGAARLLQRRGYVPLAAAIVVVFLAEAAFLPMTLNATWSDGAAQPPARIDTAADAPPVYHTLAVLPDDTVVAELPFGDPAWELRYVYYSTVHWKRLLNGYSGGFPHGYLVRAALLQRIDENPDAAWRALRDAGTTHVVVHTSAMALAEAERIVSWLDDHFAVEIARFDGDLLYDVTGVWPPAQ